MNRDPAAIGAIAKTLGRLLRVMTGHLLGRAPVPRGKRLYAHVDSFQIADDPGVEGDARAFAVTYLRGSFLQSDDEDPHGKTHATGTMSTVGHFHARRATKSESHRSGVGFLPRLIISIALMSRGFVDLGLSEPRIDCRQHQKSQERRGDDPTNHDSRQRTLDLCSGAR
jgi:hypothetical protein